METTKFAEFELSRLMLGTVQFGLNYGIANTDGKPSYDKAKAILKSAFDGGVNCFDTAAAYGDSEQVLGKAFADLGIQDDVTVVTKIDHIASKELAPGEVTGFIENSLLNSLKNLKLDVLPVCLFHHELDLDYFDVLIDLKVKGLVKHIGVSADTGKGAIDVINASATEVIQFPHNILDHRYSALGAFDKSRAQSMGVFTRSTYLQGLLLMPVSSIKEKLSEVIPVRQQLDQLADAAGMNMVEMSMRYVISNNDITSVLVGVDSVEQMTSNLDLFAKGPLPQDMLEEIDEIVPDFPEVIVRPCLWND